LTPVSHAEISKAEFLDILFQSYALGTGVWLSNKRLKRGKVLPRVGAGVKSVIIKRKSMQVVNRTARYDLPLQECNRDGAQADQHSAWIPHD